MKNTRWVVGGNYSHSLYSTKKEAINNLKAHYTKKECIAEEYDLWKEVYDEETEDWIVVEETFEKAEKYCTK